MKFSPGVPLQIGLWPDEAGAVQPVGRLAMADRRAQLEWSPEVVARERLIAPALYAPEPGLQDEKNWLRLTRGGSGGFDSCMIGWYCLRQGIFK